MLHNNLKSNFIKKQITPLKIENGTFSIFNCAVPVRFYTIEELKWDILILQWRGIGNDLKQSTPAGCGFKSSPV
jgi:hypothetical protein